MKFSGFTEEHEVRLSSKEETIITKSLSLCWISKKKRGTYSWATRGNELEDRIALSENEVFDNGHIEGIQLLRPCLCLQHSIKVSV